MMFQSFKKKKKKLFSLVRMHGTPFRTNTEHRRNVCMFDIHPLSITIKYSIYYSILIYSLNECLILIDTTVLYMYIHDISCIILISQRKRKWQQKFTKNSPFENFKDNIICISYFTHNMFCVLNWQKSCHHRKIRGTIYKKTQLVSLNGSQLFFS